ncbi:hypothetical protein Tco_0823635 [Tanacetum coccineum]|uniref:CCHC-type domain-containing protein n=1 Tax=Tanacetum coccineum TaxID=301880 RepID=A0ABQ5AIF3_9ASTR
MSTQQDINAIRAQRLSNTHDPLAFMANTQTPFHQDQSSLITYLSDPTTAINKALALIAKAFKFNTIPKSNQRIQNPGIQNVENMNGLSVVPEIANQYGNGNFVTAPDEGNGNGINGNPIRCYNCRGEGHYASNYTVKLRKCAAYLQQQLQIAQEEEAGI